MNTSPNKDLRSCSVAGRPASLVFCLLLGLLSTVGAEMFAGSMRFPFINNVHPPFVNGWGVLVTTPLYTLHIIFLAAILARFDRISWRSLLFAGAIFGLYEAYITKVLWEPGWSPEITWKLGGVSWPHTIILCLWWHPVFAFILPLFIAEMFLVKKPLFLDGLPYWLRSRIRRPRFLTTWLLVIAVLSGVIGAAPEPPILGLLAIALHGLLFALLFALWRWRGLHTRYTTRDLLPGRVGFRVTAILLALFYVFWTIAINPKHLPGLEGHITILACYAFFIVLIVWDGPMKATDELSHEPLPTIASMRLYLLGFAVCVLAAAIWSQMPFSMAGYLVGFALMFLVTIPLYAVATGKVIRKKLWPRLNETAPL